MSGQAPVLLAICEQPPFAIGDAVVHRRSPRRVETVAQIDAIDGETYLWTTWPFGQALSRCIRIRAPAAEFEPAGDRRLGWRVAGVVIAISCAAFWVALLWAALVVL
ncbi:MAG TPA: hypothetical protein VNV39_16670 [Stellaceae bacterium]|jgi:hypothetical protein|nr:hypothetical protein [Stellaceae bacterium]